MRLLFVSIFVVAWLFLSTSRAVASSAPKARYVMARHRSTTHVFFVDKQNTPQQEFNSDSNEQDSPTLGDPNEDWDVECGNGGMCRKEYPICCGRGLLAFCVSAGDKCCLSLVASPPDNMVSCAMNEICCEGSEATCCNPTQTCVEGGTRYGTCVEDVCSLRYTRFSDIALCASDHNCGWCCDTQRCVSRVQMNTDACASSLIVNTSKSYMCADRCMTASTCRRCLETLDDQGVNCGWCCQTQSCFSTSASKNGQGCDSMELISAVAGNNKGKTTEQLLEEGRAVAAAQCPKCEIGGFGLHTTSPDETQYQVLVLTIAVLMSLVGCAVMARICMGWRNPTDSPWINPVDADTHRDEVQRTIRRYGFSEHQEGGGDGEEGRGNNTTTTTTAPNEVENEAPKMKGKCDKCQAKLKVFGNKELNKEVEEELKEAICLLPCGHSLCRQCCEGQPEKHDSPTSSSRLALPDPKKKLKRKKKKVVVFGAESIVTSHGSCPLCDANVEEVLLLSHVIN